MIRVLLADDHALMRKGIRLLLEDSHEIKVVGEVESADQVLASLAATPADVLVLDIRLPGMSVFDLIPRVREAHPKVQVLILTLFEEELYGLATGKAGASGYLTKDRSPEDLVLAVTTVARGGRFFGPQTEGRLSAGARKGGQAPASAAHEGLSPRERDVLRMLGQGLGIKDIATWMHRSPKTVSTFRKRVLDKMGMSSNADIVRYVEEWGRDPSHKPL